MTGLLALGCSTQEVSALVNCEVNEGPTVECAIKQTSGTAKMEVCWDFTVTCSNRAWLEVVHACAKLKDGGATNARIPTDKIKVTGTCEGPTNGAITDLMINGKRVVGR